MSREKQIEEMEISLREAQYEYDKAWTECFHNNGKRPRRENVFYAEYLIEKKGYRKASEVARKIFEEIEKNLVLIDDVDFNRFRCIGARTFAELKKKYVEDEG